jgi:CMP-N-acetylneuraminic acid synthetase
MILGLIPARGQSKRLPGKNLKLLCGRPLIAWAIRAAQQSPYLDDLAVTTEDELIEAVARDDLQCDVIRRPVNLAHDKSLVYGAIMHAVGRRRLKDEDAVCLIQPTSPLVLREDIDRTVEEYLRTGKPAMTVALGANAANGAVYVGSVRWLKDGGTWDDQNPPPRWVAMPPERSVDINYPEDFKAAEMLMLARMAA